MGKEIMGFFSVTQANIEGCDEIITFVWSTKYGLIMKSWRHLISHLDISN
jgi:hypothetical protein